MPVFIISLYPEILTTNNRGGDYMGFKENLKKKIEIDKLATTVLHSIKPSESGKKADKTTMRLLMEMSPYHRKDERDLELYVQKDKSPPKILVMDNELPLYRTTVEDVALRKSPTIKEMVSIRNAVKILNDKDVKVAKTDASVRMIRKESLTLLDLSYDRADIEDMAGDGRSSLENGYGEGVIETLVLFQELLSYEDGPKPFEIANHKVIAPVEKKTSGEIRFGEPIVIYSLIKNRLMLIEEQLLSLNREEVEYFHAVATGKSKPTREDGEVFDYLVNAVLSLRVPYGKNIDEI